MTHRRNCLSNHLFDTLQHTVDINGTSKHPALYILNEGTQRLKRCGIQSKQQHLDRLSPSTAAHSGNGVDEPWHLTVANDEPRSLRFDASSKQSQRYITNPEATNSQRGYQTFRFG